MKIDKTQQRPAIDQDRARALGIRLCAERNTRGFSVDDIAHQLLFSSQQVIGLETANLQRFYGTRLFAQAADKYAAFLDFAEKPSATLFITEPLITPPTPPSPVGELIVEQTIEPTPASDPKPLTFRKKGLVFTLIIVCGMGAGMLFFTQGGDNTHPLSAKTPTAAPITTPTPAPTAIEAAPSAPPVQNTSAAPASPAPLVTVANTETATKADSIPNGHLKLEFNDASWVQVVEASGSRHDKLYKAGETLDLEPAKLQALVIGNAKAVTAQTSRGNINLATYVASGSQVARIIGPQVRQLTQRSSQ